MKTLLSFLFVVSVATICTAQTIASTSISNSQMIENYSNGLSESKRKRIALRQNGLAINQLQTFLAERLKYSELMAENCTEGEVIVQVNISEFGFIIKNRIIKSPNEMTSNAVLNVMKGFTQVNINENVYFGHKKIRIPIKFSIH